MKVIVFGATGMVGQGVLRECLRDPAIERVLVVGRTSLGSTDAKVEELLLTDLTDYSGVANRLAGYDACFFCLGVSAGGMTEAEYRRITYDYALAAARTLAEKNPGMTFIYVSGAGTGGRAMWARVKGETENALLKLPLKAVMFRPAYIQPMEGIVSKTKSYRMMYAVMAPLYPVWNALFPKFVTTTQKVGRAMIAVAKQGAPRAILENPDINALGSAPPPAG